MAEEKLYRVALREALGEEMERDDSVYLIGEDIGKFGGAYRVTDGLLDKFGAERVVDAPIAEEVIVGTAIGSAMLGLRPVVEMMTINFSLVAYDQIVNNAAKIRYMFGGEAKVPMVIRMPGGAGHQLSAQHSHSFEVLYGLIPGLLVVAPTTPEDAKGMLKSAIRTDNPVMFLESMSLYNVRGHGARRRLHDAARQGGGAAQRIATSRSSACRAWRCSPTRRPSSSRRRTSTSRSSTCARSAPSTGSRSSSR